MKANIFFIVSLIAAVGIGIALDRLVVSAEAGRTEAETIVSRKAIPAQKRGVTAVRKRELDERTKRVAALKEEREALLRDAKDDRELSELISELKDLLRDELTPVERKMVKALDAALEKDDAKSVRTLVREARKIGNAGVRKTAVAAAGWIGEEAMPELEEFISDDNPEVSEEALTQWELALQEIEDEAKKLDMLKQVLLTLKDEGTCDYLSIHLITAGDEALALKTIRELIASGNEACKVPAKDAYSWITGKDWAGR